MDTVGPANCKVNIEVEIETLLGFSDSLELCAKKLREANGFQVFWDW